MCFGVARGFIPENRAGFTVELFILDNMYILFLARIPCSLKMLTANIRKKCYTFHIIICVLILVLNLGEMSVR
jgi:uncharacterized membrane protein